MIIKQTDADPLQIAAQLVRAGPRGAPEIIRSLDREVYERALDLIEIEGMHREVREICLAAVLAPRTYNQDVPHLMERLSSATRADWGKAEWESPPSTRRALVIAVSAFVLEQSEVAEHYWKRSDAGKDFRGYRALYAADLSPPGCEIKVLEWLLDKGTPPDQIACSISGHPVPDRQGLWVEAAVHLQHPGLLRALARESAAPSRAPAGPELRAA